MSHCINSAENECLANAVTQRAYLIPNDQLIAAASIAGCNNAVPSEIEQSLPPVSALAHTIDPLLD